MNQLESDQVTERGSTAYLVMICLVATLGGLLFGYDTAVISGAIGFLQTHFQLVASMKGWAASSALVGCFLGVAFAGEMNDRLGRRTTLLISAVLFLVSAIGSAVPETLTPFIVFRVIGGLGVGIASMTSPMYIAEISPARIRGRMVSLNQFAIVFGMLVVYFVNFFIGSHGTSINRQVASQVVKQLRPEIVLDEPATRIVENRIVSQIEMYRQPVGENAIKKMAAVLDRILENSEVDRAGRLSRLNEELDLQLSQWDSKEICEAVATELSDYGLKLAEEDVESLAPQWAEQLENELDIEFLARGHMAHLLEKELSAAGARVSVSPERIAASLIGSVEGQGASSWNVLTGWRWMFGSEALPALLLFCLLLLVPESPRFLTKQGRSDRAREILTRIGGPLQAAREMAEIESSLAEESGSLTQLFRPGMRILLWIGVTLAVLQQVTGINVFLYYAPEIFKQVAGEGMDIALMQTILVGAVNLGFTILAIWTVDKLGRKPLMIVGSLGMGISLAAIGTAAYMQNMGSWLLVFMLGYIACFAVSVGPVTWVILSEIFPTKIRGRAMAIATFFLWVANFVVSQTFPMMDAADSWLVKTFHHGFPFWIYGVFCVVLAVFVWKVVPETKGKSLEEIEKQWIVQRERP